MYIWVGVYPVSDAHDTTRYLATLAVPLGCDPPRVIGSYGVLLCISAYGSDADPDCMLAGSATLHILATTTSPQVGYES